MHRFNLKFKDGRTYNNATLRFWNSHTGEYATKSNIDLMIKGDLEPVFDMSHYEVVDVNNNLTIIETEDFFENFDSYEIIEKG
jgi:hypothetical protein